MLTLEQSTKNIITTKGLSIIPIEAFQFNWDILNRVFVSTFRKFERYCPLVKTIQTTGGNPAKMPDNCIYPRAVTFGDAAMIAPQSASVGSQNWSYDRQTKMLSVFTNTGSNSNLKVQYLAMHDELSMSYSDQVEVYDGDANVEVELQSVPDTTTLKIALDNLDLQVKSRDRYSIELEGALGTGLIDLNTLVLTINLAEGIPAGQIQISYDSKYKAFDYVGDEQDFFETWYASNILTSMGNTKAVVNMDAMPNNINADELRSQGQDLYKDVLEFQKEKSYWFRGYINSRV